MTSCGGSEAARQGAAPGTAQIAQKLRSSAGTCRVLGAPAHRTRIVGGHTARFCAFWGRLCASRGVRACRGLSRESGAFARVGGLRASRGAPCAFGHARVLLRILLRILGRSARFVTPGRTVLSAMRIAPRAPARELAAADSRPTDPQNPVSAPDSGRLTAAGATECTQVGVRTKFGLHCGSKWVIVGPACEAKPNPGGRAPPTQPPWFGVRPRRSEAWPDTTFATDELHCPDSAEPSSTRWTPSTG